MKTILLPGTRQTPLGYYIAVAVAGAMLMQSECGAAEKIHLPEVPNRVVVKKRPGDTQYVRIPSPGNNYDELYYDVKIGASSGKYYLQSTLKLTPERDDRITVPYVRLLTTTGVEFAMMTFSNAMFWSGGEYLSRSMRLPFLPRKYYIACGFAYYYDTMYPHMQGGPQETIVESDTGRITYRGRPRNADNYLIDISNTSGLLFMGDTIHARVKEYRDPSTSAAVTEVAINYAIYDIKSGRRVTERSAVQEFIFSPTMPGNYLLSFSVGNKNMILWRDIRMITILPKLEWTDKPEYLGNLIVNDSIGCGLEDDPHAFRDGRSVESFGEVEITERLTGSHTTNSFGGKGRVIAYDRGFFGYTLGMNLTLGMPYVLEIEYPEDVPRTYAFLFSNGTYTPGIHTGHTLGQPEPRYFNEQIMFPLSHSIHKARFIVWAGFEEVRNGFYVGVADPGRRNAPFSHKPLVLKMTLYSFMSIACPRIKTDFPPELRRYAWVESEDIIPHDQVRFSPHMNALFYGMNALSPAMLGWNAHGDINNSIMFRSPRYNKPVRTFMNGNEYETDKMENISNRYDFASEYLTWARELNLSVFPRFEYGGSDALPPETRAIREDGQPYPAYPRPSTGNMLHDSVDVCYPVVKDDLTGLIHEFMDGQTEDNKTCLRQPIIRRRGHFMATSYSPLAIKTFEQESGIALEGDTEQEKRASLINQNNERYRQWYQHKLYDLLAVVYTSYWAGLQSKPAPLLYYHWQNPGMPYEGVYYENSYEWETTGKKIRNLPFEGLPLPKITSDDLLKAVRAWTSTEEGLYLDSIPSSIILPVAPVYGERAATSAAYFDLFRKNGKLAVKIVPSIHSTTKIYRQGRRKYFAGQTLYHSRQFSMLEPVESAASAMPTYMAFEQAHPACFPFPEYTRRFFMNYLALPAVPFKPVPQPGNEIMRVTMGQYGSKKYVCVINTAMAPVKARIVLPLDKVNRLSQLVESMEPMNFFINEGTISFNVTLDALELRSYVVE